MKETAKHDDRDAVIRVLSRLPADASLEDIRYEFETIFGILEGMRDADEGRTYSHEEVMEMVRQWRSKSAGRPAPART
jgi:predicted transcriptional regulator